MRYIVGSFFIATFSAAGALYAATSETADAEQKAQALIKEFATTLQGELKTALTEGGPIGVCGTSGTSSGGPAGGVPGGISMPSGSCSRSSGGMGPIVSGRSSRFSDLPSSV